MANDPRTGRTTFDQLSIIYIVVITFKDWLWKHREINLLNFHVALLSSLNHVVIILSGVHNVSCFN